MIIRRNWVRFRRYLDDYFCQKVIRSQLAYRVLPSLDLPPSMERLPDEQVAEVEAKAGELLTAAARNFLEKFIQVGRVRDVRVEQIHLPCKRLFEIGFDVKVESI